jgi:3-phytase
MKRNFAVLAAVIMLLVAPEAANATASPIPPSGPVPATDETQAFASGTGDLADDPAIWVNPADPALSVVIGSKKAASDGGLGVYDVDGNQIQFLSAGEANNVDIRTVDGKVVVMATVRTDNTLRFFYLDPSTRALTAAGSIGTGFEPYGGCLYNDGSNLYGFVTNRNSPFDFDQYRLTVGATTVTGSKVRDLKTSSLSEGCVGDDERGVVFLSQERSGVYRYSASPTGGKRRTTVAAVGTNGVTADVEGLAIARGRDAADPDHLIVSSQGASTFQVFDAAAPHTFRKSFTVEASGCVDAVTGTDGVEITRANLGPLYPNGLLVVHDTSNSGGSVSNFKYADAGQVLGA